MSIAQERRFALLITLAALLLFSFYGLTTPLFEASDELWHYPLVQHFASGGGLPVQRAGQTDAEAPWRQEGSQPPLYYWLAALATAPLDDSDWRALRRINPHGDMGVPTRDGNVNAILHTPQERAFPWVGAALAVRVARLVSVLLSAGSVWFAYRAAEQLFPRHSTQDSRAWLRLSVPLVVAHTPMFAFISGSVNNDNAAVFFSTMGVWWALRVWRHHDLSLRSAVVAGLLSGLGALSKSSALGLLALFGLAALLARGAAPSSAWVWAWDRARWITVMTLMALAISGWWFVRNRVLYGDWLGWNAFLDVVGRRDVPATLAQLWSEREGFVWSYWGVFGTMNVIYPAWVYDVLNGLALVAGLGVAWRLARGKVSAVGLRALLIGGAWVGLTFVALLRWTSLTPASQGRLMFPCIALLAAGLAYGWWAWHRVVLAGGALVLVVLAWVTPLWIIAPAYAPPAEGWVRPLAQRVDAVFGGAVLLAEAEADARAVRPGDTATLQLNWALLQPVARNYSVFVHLVDEHDVIVAQRDMHPGQGRLALSELPAGYRWSDFYAVRVPAWALAPATLRWVVGIYDHATGDRLPLANGTDRLFLSDDLSLTLQPAERTTPLLRYTNGVALLAYTASARVLRAGETLTITTQWQLEQPPQGTWAISLQLLDEGANKIAQHDVGQPLAEWQRGALVTLTHPLAVRADATSGVYRLLLVWYSPQDLKRAPAYDARGQFVGDQIVLTRFRLP
ncbi:MAG: hypothetical protein NZL91_09560 [Thermoflexales bacterium]|nr:hypothetical protein [Thermoflexales bacterium]MCS7324984.1 hypothetical protein [Thermoflexales bacterium]MDW8292405.1 hypothetical protein [Anaerolineae bacterium]